MRWWRGCRGGGTAIILSALEVSVFECWSSAPSPRCRELTIPASPASFAWRQLRELDAALCAVAPSLVSRVDKVPDKGRRWCVRVRNGGDGGKETRGMVIYSSVPASAAVLTRAL